MTEKELQRALSDALRVFGWRAYHPWTSVHSAAGYPDLCAVRGQRLLYAELKGDRGRLTPQQNAWLEALRGVVRPPDVYLWTPADLDHALEVLR